MTNDDDIIRSLTTHYIKLNVGTPKAQVKSKFLQSLTKTATIHETTVLNKDDHCFYMYNRPSANTGSLYSYYYNDETQYYTSLSQIHTAMEQGTYRSEYMMGVEVELNEETIELLHMVPASIRYGGLLQYSGKFPGVSTPFVYISKSGTVFTFHAEDSDLCGYVYVIEGTKHFYVLAPEKLKDLPQEIVYCLLTKQIFLNEHTLSKYFELVTVKAGEVLYFNGGIHGGYNEKAVAISMNVMLPETCLRSTELLLEKNSKFSFPIASVVPINLMLLTMYANTGLPALQSCMMLHDTRYSEWKMKNKRYTFNLCDKPDVAILFKQCILCNNYMYFAYHLDVYQKFWCYSCVYHIKGNIIMNEMCLNEKYYLQYFKGNISITADVYSLLDKMKEFINKGMVLNWSAYKNNYKRPMNRTEFLFALMQTLHLYSAYSKPNGKYTVTASYAPTETTVSEIQRLQDLYNSHSAYFDEVISDKLPILSIREHYCVNEYYYFRCFVSDTESRMLNIVDLVDPTTNTYLPVLMNYCTSRHLHHVIEIINEEEDVEYTPCKANATVNHDEDVQEFNEPPSKRRRYVKRTISTSDEDSDK
jgi:hypothetical protein